VNEDVHGYVDGYVDVAGYFDVDGYVDVDAQVDAHEDGPRGC